MKRIGVIGLILATLVAGVVWAGRSSDPLPADTQADLIVVEKGKRLLSLYANGAELRTYRIALGREPVGSKEREGDDRTPEGRYVIDSRKRGARPSIMEAYSPAKLAPDLPRTRAITSGMCRASSLLLPYGG